MPMMGVNGVVISLCCIAVVCLLPRAHAQESTTEASNIPYGGNCRYNTQCLNMVGIICKYSPENDASTCVCGEYLKLSDDGQDCLRDIGASCTSHAECTLQYKYQEGRTCGAERVCECTGNGDCGDGLTRAPLDNGQDFATDPAGLFPVDRHTSRPPFTTPRVTNAPPRTASSVGPVIHAAGVGGAVRNTGTATSVGSILLLLLSTVITKLYNL